MAHARRILTAELLSIGSELTVGDTRDTNAGDLARSLTGSGVAVGRMQAVPDDLATVRDAFTAAIRRVDLVVSTGGLGPTPDDLTREAIALVVGETPAPDPELERWLRGLWSRRGAQFPEMNLKQAWLLPSATALANRNGTAPGWWVERADGGVLIALPGPPREMRPMWSDIALPRLLARGAGLPVASRTLRLAGIGESQVAELLGEVLLRSRDPIVATYARADAVDVRISARDEPFPPGRVAFTGEGTPSTLAAERVAAVTERLARLLAEHVWAEGETTWAEAIGAALDERGQTLALVEVATGGSLATLLGDREWLRLGERRASDSGPTSGQGGFAVLEALARSATERGGASIGAAVQARARGADTAVSIVVVGLDWVHRERQTVFLGGADGRNRAGLTAARVLLKAIRAQPGAPDGSPAPRSADRRAI